MDDECGCEECNCDECNHNHCYVDDNNKEICECDGDCECHHHNEK